MQEKDIALNYLERIRTSHIGMLLVCIAVILVTQQELKDYRKALIELHVMEKILSDNNFHETVVKGAIDNRINSLGKEKNQKIKVINDVIFESLEPLLGEVITPSDLNNIDYLLFDAILQLNNEHLVNDGFTSRASLMRNLGSETKIGDIYSLLYSLDSLDKLQVVVGFKPEIYRLSDEGQASDGCAVRNATVLPHQFGKSPIKLDNRFSSSKPQVNLTRFFKDNCLGRDKADNNLQGSIRRVGSDFGVERLAIGITFRPDIERNGVNNTKKYRDMDKVSYQIELVTESLELDVDSYYFSILEPRLSEVEEKIVKLKFRGLRDFIDSSHYRESLLDMNIKELTAEVTNQERQNSGVYDVFGLKIPSVLTTPWGAAFISLFLLYFSQHVKNFEALRFKSISLPWIGYYPSYTSFILLLLSTILMPCYAIFMAIYHAPNTALLDKLAISVNAFIAIWALVSCFLVLRKLPAFESVKKNLCK